MPVSQRVLGGSKTKGTTAKYIGFATGSDSVYSDLREGSSLRFIEDLSTNFMRQIMRGNSGLVRTVNGKQVSDKNFNDSISNLQIPLNADKSEIISFSTESPFSMDISGKVSQKFHHRREKDFGQTEVYDDNFPYFDHMPVNPIDVVLTHPANLELPPALVDSNSISDFDGVIDILDLRNRKERSGVETPFHARGLKSSMGQTESSYKRCSEIKFGRDVGDVIEPEHFLDNDLSVTQKSGASYFSLYNPGVVSVDFQKIEPFVDRYSDSEKVYKESNLKGDLKNHFINLPASSSYSMGLENYQTHDKMSSTGFVYGYSNSGVDSIAYGGLEK